MKLTMVWLCIIAEAYTFPTQSTNTGNGNTCCIGNPRLIYKGHDTKHGINVFVFEFLSSKEETTSKKAEDGLISKPKNYEFEGGGVIQEEENGARPEEPTGVDRGDILFDTESFFDNETLAEDDTESKLSLIFSKKSTNGKQPINGSKNNEVERGTIFGGVPQAEKNDSRAKETPDFVHNDIISGTESLFDNETLAEDDTLSKMSFKFSKNGTKGKGKDKKNGSSNMESDFGLEDDLIGYIPAIPNTASPGGDHHNKNSQNPNELNDNDGYYKTEGSAYVEIPDDYNNFGNVINPNISIHFHATDMTKNPVECSGNVCWNATKQTTKTLESVGKETRIKNDSVSVISNIKHKNHGDNKNPVVGDSGHERNRKKKINSETSAKGTRKDTTENNNNYGKKTKEPIKNNKHIWRNFPRHGFRYLPRRHQYTQRHKSFRSSSESDSSSSQNFD
ncbi:uncharacterized protein O3C94_000402 [Discoglossus pictus]